MNGEGEAIMRQNKTTGLWEARVDFGVIDGKRKRVTRKDKTKAGLRRKLRELETDKDEGRRPLSKTYTAGQWLRHWLDDVVPNLDLADNTRLFYAGHVERYLIPALGKVALVDLEVADVDRMMADMRRRGLSATTASGACKTLGTALKAAILARRVHRNVAALAKTHKAPPKVDDALDLEEIQTVLATAAGDRLEALAVLALGTGMRQGEAALDLEWSAVKLDQAVLRVRDAKTPAGVREIPLPAFVVEALRRHRQTQRLERMAAKSWHESDLVFTRVRGDRLTRADVWRWWQRLLIRAGIPRRRFHASRHSAASLMLNSGVPLEVVSAILGHASIRITSDVYAKVREPLKRDAAARIDALLGVAK